MEISVDNTETPVTLAVAKGLPWIPLKFLMKFILFSSLYPIHGNWNYFKDSFRWRFYILLTIAWFIPQPCNSNRCSCDHTNSSLCFRASSRTTLPPETTQALWQKHLRPSPYSLHGRLTVTSSPIRKKWEGWKKKILKLLKHTKVFLLQ